MIKFVLSILVAVVLNISNAFSKDTEVENYVHQLISDSISILSDNNLDAKRKNVKVKEMLSKNLDSTWMAKFVLGRKVKTLPKETLNKFTKIYEKYLLSSYASAIGEYKGEKVEIRSLDTLDNGFFIVKSHVIKTGGNFISVEYLAHKVDDIYKVCDIITEGISLVNSQRSEYSSIIENESIDVLMKELTKKTQ